MGALEPQVEGREPEESRHLDEQSKRPITDPHDFPENAKLRERTFDELGSQMSDIMQELPELVEPYGDLPGLDTELLETVLSLWFEAFNNDAARKSYLQAPKDEREQSWINGDAIRDVRNNVGYLRNYLVAIKDPSLVSSPLRSLRSDLEAAVRRGRRAKFGYLSPDERLELRQLLDFLGRTLDTLKDREAIRNLSNQAKGAVAQAEASATEATTAADASKLAAGITGDANLSLFYGELAENEGTKADKFRRITVTMAFTGAASAALFILGPGLGLAMLDISSGDYVHLIQRAVFVAGVFGLAGYFARQAQQHRSMANWASALCVQLKTFDAYLHSIDNPDVKDELRKVFASRVFGDHPPMKGEPAVTPSAAAMDTAVEWAAKLTSGGK